MRSAAARGPAAVPPTSRSSTCSAGTAWPARASCSAWTGPPTDAGAGPASPVRTATCRSIVVAVGDASRIAAAVAELDEALGEPPRTLERVRVCKRDGATLGEPHDARARAAGSGSRSSAASSRATRAGRSPRPSSARCALRRGRRDRPARRVGLPRRPRAARRHACCRCAGASRSSSPRSTRRSGPPRLRGRSTASPRPTGSCCPSACPAFRATGPRGHARRASTSTRAQAGGGRARRAPTGWTSSNERSRSRSTRSTSPSSCAVDLVADDGARCRPSPPSTSAVWTSSSDDERRATRAAGSCRRTTGSGGRRCRRACCSGDRASGRPRRVPDACRRG